MKLICTMAARNEEWCLGLTARAVLLWVDELVILDHCSTDRTREIALEIGREFHPRVTVVGDSNPEWQEMRHRQAMLEMARVLDATHIVYVDSDEILSANLLPRIRNLVECAQPGLILQIPWLQLRDSIYRYHVNGVWAEQMASVAFRDDQRYHWAAREGYDFHQRNPMGLPLAVFKPIRRNLGGLLHLQMVSERRLKAKQYLYQLTERVRWPGREPVEAIRKRYSLAVYGKETDEKPKTPLERAIRIQRGDDEPLTYAMTPPEWWDVYEPWLKYLNVDAEPWQLAECQKILAEHPGIGEGLDSFGLEL